MSKSTKPAAWALKLAASLAAGTSTSGASTATAPARAPRPSKRAARRAAKKQALASAKKLAKKVSPDLAGALYTSSTLPENEPVWLACRQRLIDLIDQVDNDTTALAELLGVTRRSAQRLRAAYGIERRLVRGQWR